MRGGVEKIAGRLTTGACFGAPGAAMGLGGGPFGIAAEAERDSMLWPGAGAEVAFTC